MWWRHSALPSAWLWEDTSWDKAFRNGKFFRHDMCELTTKCLRLPAVILTSALLLCALVGCENSRNDIIGKWRSGDSNAMVWEFVKDGSVLMGSTKGRYSFGDRNRVKIETPFGTSVYQLELADNRMLLTDPTGSRLEFTRMK
jgi:hypothetical protein